MSLCSCSWDTNDTDNTLTAICKPNKLYDIPPGTDMPRLKCEARSVIVINKSYQQPSLLK